MLTDNERKVLRIIFTSFEEQSINQIAKLSQLSPNGAYKILKKFENEGVLNSKKISNIISYEFDFSNEKTKNIISLALVPHLNARVKLRYEDLKDLKTVTHVGIMFGSYIDLKKEPNDLDIFFIIDEKHYKTYKEISSKIFKTIPIKVQDVLQTEEDFMKNIIKKDKVLFEILKTGTVLWGYDKIIDLIKNGNIRKN